MLVRILAAAVGLPLLLAIVLLLPPIGTAVLFALACMVGAYEMLWRTGILKNKRIVAYTAVMAALHRSFRFVQKPQVSGVLFPGSLDMALISVYGDAGVAPLMFEVPSLLARECERLALPNALQALDQTVFLMQNFGVSDFGLRLPVGIAGRDEGAWRFMLGQIRHYQPRCVQFVDVSGGQVAEHPAFSEVRQALAQQGLAERAPNLLCAGSKKSLGIR